MAASGLLAYEIAAPPPPPDPLPPDSCPPVSPSPDSLSAPLQVSVPHDTSPGQNPVGPMFREAPSEGPKRDLYNKLGRMNQSLVLRAVKRE